MARHYSPAWLAATAAPRRRAYDLRKRSGSLAILAAIRQASSRLRCKSACKKDPLFGVIGIQSGPQHRGPTLASVIHGSRGMLVVETIARGGRTKAPPFTMSRFGQIRNRAAPPV